MDFAIFDPRVFFSVFTLTLHAYIYKRVFNPSPFTFLFNILCVSELRVKGGVGGGFISREPVLLSGGCCRFGISGVSGDRSQYCDVAFAAQQGPHAVALHADLDFVSFGEHCFDLLEKQTVRKLHHGRGFADSPPKIVRQASSAAAASGRHSRW